MLVQLGVPSMYCLHLFADDRDYRHEMQLMPFGERTSLGNICGNRIRKITKGDYMMTANSAVLTCYSSRGELTWWRGLILHANLDNRMSAKPSVQMTHNTVNANGCHSTLVFSTTPNPQVRLDIAEMLVTAFEKRRRIQ